MEKSIPSKSPNKYLPRLAVAIKRHVDGVEIELARHGISSKLSGGIFIVTNAYAE